MKKLDVTQEAVQKAWLNGNTEQRQLLENLFGDTAKVPVDIKDRVKSYEDACLELGIKAVSFDYLPERERKHLSALIKLETITKALNEGWENPQNGEGYVYWPWFYILNNKKEVEDYRDRGYTVVELEGFKNTSGLAYSNSHNAPSNAYAVIGSRLCFKSRDLAVYAAKTFTSLYADYLLI